MSRDVKEKLADDVVLGDEERQMPDARRNVTWSANRTIERELSAWLLYQ